MDKDREMPKLTCKDRSTADYFLSTVHIFQFIQDFDILDFSVLYSDARTAQLHYRWLCLCII